MKKVLYLLGIFCIILFSASCTSTKKELPEPPVQEEAVPEQVEQEPVQEEEQPVEIQQPEQPQEEPEPQPPVVQEIPLPEEVEIFDEPEVTEEEPEEEYEDYQEEETQSEIFEVLAEEEDILAQEPEDIPVEETIEVPEGFTAEETSAEVPPVEKVNLEELNALSEKEPEEQPAVIEEEVQTEETDSFETEGMTDEVEVEEVFEEEIIPSRTMSLLRNQYIDVVYPGSGWVYLGETDDTEIFRYQGRKSETSRTIFTLKSLRGGTAVLHFYKNDILTGNYIDDYLEVTVDDERTFDTKHVEAPSYEEIVPERLLSSQEKNDSAEAHEDSAELPENNSSAAEASIPEEDKTVRAKKDSGSQIKHSENKQTAQKTESFEGQTNIQKTDSGSTKSSAKKEPAQARQSQITETAPAEPQEQTAPSSDKYNDLTSEELLSKAKKAFKDKKYSETLDYLDSFFDKAVTHVDEALYLKGQTLETKSEVRNIKAALEAYEDLVKKYPQSNLWSKSNDRITYLKRFYFNIR